MATERLSMRSTREIIRQKWELGRSHRAISGSVGVSVGAVSLALSRATAAELTWEAVQALDDAQLEAALYPSVVLEAARAEPDCVWIHRERHRVGVTLELLHHEYLERHPGGLRYTAFCDRYRAWAGRRGLVMRQVHVAGDKLFVDYSGKRARIVDAATGEVIEVELFVATLGASNLTYAEATRTQRGPDWIASHVRALEYFGGVPAALVPDQLKSGVTRSCAYEPEVQRTYDEARAALRHDGDAGAVALWRSVAHGGDSDSTGSITGNLLGAMHGIGALPERWLAQLELRDVIERVARDLFASSILEAEPDLESYPAS